MPPLQALPVEILEQICGYVALEFPVGLYDLALVNRNWYAVAGRYRFQRIQINVVNRHRLAVDVYDWYKALHAYSALSSVRHILVRGRMPPLEKDTPWTSRLDEWATDGHTEDELTRMDHHYNQTIACLFDIKPNHETDGWDPLIRLLGQLSGLRDLIWDCDTQIPSSALHILDQTLPRCKLHIKGFKLPSLNQDGRDAKEVDESDYALVTSKCLTSVLAPLSHYNLEGVDYNEEAVMEMATDLAPNLTHMHVVYRPVHSNEFLNRVVSRGRPPWRGFFLKDPRDPWNIEGEVSRPIHLQCWSLSPAKMDYFKRWEKQVVFSELRILHLWEVSSETLTSARNYQFSSLKTLALDLSSPHGPPEDMNGLDEAASTFLSEIAARLESIHLSGLPTSEKAFHTALENHGKSLHTLSLISPGGSSLTGPQMTVGRIKEIQTHCPRIRDLRLAIQRTQGNKQEAEIYEALGGFPHLTELLLQLGLTNGIPMRYTRGLIFSASGHGRDVRDTFINAAVDETLTRSIFRKIVKSGAFSLQRLKVGVNAEITDPPDLGEITRTMARQWECIRVSGMEDRDTKGRDFRVFVRDMGRKSKIFHGTLNHGEQVVQLGYFEEPFRKLWPVRTLRWDQDWRSIPLH